MGPGLQHLAEMVFSLGFGYAFLAQVRFYHSTTYSSPGSADPSIWDAAGTMLFIDFLFLFGRHQNTQRKRQGGAQEGNLAPI